MLISDILKPERVLCNVDTGSKKAALELLAQLIADAESGLTQTEVFGSLLAREKLGSTGLGKGIALPHGRLKQGIKTLGAFIRLQTAVDYDSTDKVPVDLLFALVVPEESTQEHLDILAKLAELFSDEGNLEKIRSGASNTDIYDILVS
jgi:PTS system nitrogen regulatory IIA component